MPLDPIIVKEAWGALYLKNGLTVALDGDNFSVSKTTSRDMGAEVHPPAAIEHLVEFLQQHDSPIIAIGEQNIGAEAGCSFLTADGDNECFDADVDDNNNVTVKHKEMLEELNAFFELVTFNWSELKNETAD